ncbi:MAG: Vacuolar H+transporting two-sector ATPase F subunit [Magnetococcales bacterium]|nr:Vacuolar H+transporting two-sector ATPase F subunit [Magnetococcales bacterium]
MAVTVPVFIGDEVSAAGWRLAGVRVMVPESGEEATLVTEMLSAATELLLLSSECARNLPQVLLDRLLSSTMPMTLIVPDVRGQVAPPDLMARVRSRLGMSG